MRNFNARKNFPSSKESDAYTLRRNYKTLRPTKKRSELINVYEQITERDGIVKILKHK